jgi:hypothetical protein
MIDRELLEHLYIEIGKYEIIIQNKIKYDEFILACAVWDENLENIK